MNMLIHKFQLFWCVEKMLTRKYTTCEDAYTRFTAFCVTWIELKNDIPINI